MVTKPDRAMLESEIVELRSALVKAQKAGSKRASNTEQLVKAVHMAARDAMLAHGPVPRVARPAVDRRKAKPEVALLHLTDWQLGKKSSSFNVEVCNQRIMQAVDKTIQLTNIQRAHHPVREIHVMFGGDMVEGLSIFPGQAHEVEANLYAQFVGVANLCAAVIVRLAEHFDHVHVWEEKGNHGRLGHKGEMPSTDNIDLFAYTLAEAFMGTQPRVTWHKYTGPIGTHVPIGNYTAFLVHGDEVQSFGGNTPAFGILRKSNAWATGVVAPFDDVYMGHWHTPMMLTMANGGRVFVSGSPESDNEYAREFVAAVGRPSQRLNFIDPARGRVTTEYVLWLD
jgi:hypothetical protein